LGNRSTGRFSRKSLPSPGGKSMKRTGKRVRAEKRERRGLEKPLGGRRPEIGKGDKKKNPTTVTAAGAAKKRKSENSHKTMSEASRYGKEKNFSSTGLRRPKADSSQTYHDYGLLKKRRRKPNGSVELREKEASKPVKKRRGTPRRPSRKNGTTKSEPRKTRPRPKETHLLHRDRNSHARNRRGGTKSCRRPSRSRKRPPPDTWEGEEEGKQDRLATKFDQFTLTDTQRGAAPSHWLSPGNRELGGSCRCNLN